MEHTDSRQSSSMKLFSNSALSLNTSIYNKRTRQINGSQLGYCVTYKFVEMFFYFLFFLNIAFPKKHVNSKFVNKQR